MDADGRVTMNHDFLAAVDLGSNSFHLTVARLAHGEVQVVDRLRIRVGLAEGLGPSQAISKEVADRALDCLRQFGERVADVAPHRMRAVGTYTLRRMRDADEFLAQAEDALGHAIEVVSGAEEARLIYLGVSHDLPPSPGRRLIVDIGGGSTECIVGEGFDALAMDSLSMGCVSFSQRFFDGGEITSRRFERAVLAARLELETLEDAYRERGWDECVGSSGTILAVREILDQNGWTAGAITAKGVRKLAKTLVSAGSTKELELPGLAQDRRAVLPGGLAILQAVFAALEIDEMAASQGALREGVLYDLLGRIQHEDARDRTIRAFAARYGVDDTQAGRVAATVARLAEQAAEPWGLDAAQLRLLRWAARIHEVGLAVSYAGHHKHGAYLVQNSVLPGFSREDQVLLATLIRNHRRKPSRTSLKSVRSMSTKRVARLAALLRLGVRLHRSRRSGRVPPITVRAREGRLRLIFPEGWLDEQPLTRADLEDESTLLERIGIELRLSDGDPESDGRG